MKKQNHPLQICFQDGHRPSCTVVFRVHTWASVWSPELGGRCEVKSSWRADWSSRFAPSTTFSLIPSLKRRTQKIRKTRCFYCNHLTRMFYSLLIVCFGISKSTKKQQQFKEHASKYHLATTTVIHFQHCWMDFGISLVPITWAITPKMLVLATMHWNRRWLI